MENAKLQIDLQQYAATSTNARAAQISLRGPASSGEKQLAVVNAYANVGHGFYSGNRHMSYFLVGSKDRDPIQEL